MAANYQSNLSQTLIKRIRGEPDQARLENLELTNGFISPFCLHMIAKSIVFNNQQNNINGALFDVNLGRNQICGINNEGEGEYDPSGLVELLDTLSLSRCLRTLNLEKNFLGVPACVALGKLLETRNPMSHLSLKGCSLTTEELTKIVLKMKKNTHLQILNLGSNFLNMHALEKLGKAIVDKRCELHYLDLSNNNLGEKEAEVLITLVKENQSITTLILDDNFFPDEGMKHIGAMLTRAKQLEQLSMQNCGIGFFGSREIALALEQNTKLKYLGVQWNSMSNPAVELLAKALMNNIALKAISLVGNDFDDTKAALLMEASLIKNTTAISIDVPSAPLRTPFIALKELEGIEYYPFQA